MNKKLITVLTLILFTAFLFTACGEGGDSSSAAKKGEPTGMLTIGAEDSKGVFIPYFANSAYDQAVTSLVFQGLIRRNYDGVYVGDVAKDWEYSNDGKTITFNMKKDVVFSDGTPLTAYDVAFTYAVYADPSFTGSDAAVVDMVGYDEYKAGETTEFKGVVAKDKYTVEFNFKEALRPNFTNCGASIVPKHYFGKDYKVGDVSSVEAITTDVIGSGPYKIVNFEPQQAILLERNMKYSGDGAYNIKEILIKFVAMDTDADELIAGNVDLLASMVEQHKIAKIKNAIDNVVINDYQRSGYGYIKTNCQVGPTSEVAVRKALYYSFNIDEFVNSYFKNEETGDVMAKIQYHPFSQVSWVMDEKLENELIEYKFDLEKAKSILDEAGWKLNANGKREKNGELLTIKAIAMPDHDILDTLIPMWQRDWAEGLGVELKIEKLEFNSILDIIIYNSDEYVNEWSLFFLATTITSADPHGMNTGYKTEFIGNNLGNTSRYSNSKVDELFEKGKTIMEVEKAKPIYREIAKILNEEAVMMPIYSNIYYDMYYPKLKNFKTHALYDWTDAMRDAYIEE